jgi:hypothetical protein
MLVLRGTQLRDMTIDLERSQSRHLVDVRAVIKVTTELVLQARLQRLSRAIVAGVPDDAGLSN